MALLFNQKAGLILLIIGVILLISAVPLSEMSVISVEGAGIKATASDISEKSVISIFSGIVCMISGIILLKKKKK